LQPPARSKDSGFIGHIPFFDAFLDGNRSILGESAALATIGGQFAPIY
jgi:hypothetical protein